jgi:2-amino-4-hydroxy-6-hydroxymethyldihydropteridine diphosphokinase
MNEEKRHQAFLGLGTNMGDRRENLLKGLRLLDNRGDMSIREVSSVYESEPWGVLDQPCFLNMVALVCTSLSPEGLLEACLGVEAELGRTRSEKWGPRIIDVDILLFDELEIGGAELTVPHPRMLEREFVMAPLLELRPRITIPGKDGLQASYPAGGQGKATKAFRFDKEEWHG